MATLADLSLHKYTQVRLLATEALIVIMSRNILPGHYLRDKCILSPLFQQNKMTVLETAWAKMHHVYMADHIDTAQQKHLVEEEEYNVIKRFAHMIQLMAQYQICFKRNDKLPVNFECFFSLCQHIERHPSLLVASCGIQVFIDLFKHDQLKFIVGTPAVIKALLDELVPKLVRVNSAHLGSKIRAI